MALTPKVILHPSKVKGSKRHHFTVSSGNGNVITTSKPYADFSTAKRAASNYLKMIKRCHNIPIIVRTTKVVS